MGGNGNKLLPLFGGVAVALLLIVLLRPSKQTNETGTPVVPRAASPDVDSPADTVRSLTVKLDEIRRETDGLRKENQELIKQRPEIAKQVRADLEDEHGAETQELSRRLDDLTQRLSGGKSQGVASNISLGQPAEIPLSLGTPSPSGLVWVDPLDQPTRNPANTVAIPQPSAPVDSSSLLHDGGGLEPKVRLPEPAFTVPRNATLVGSTAMTALIGRVPVRGQVEDPYPFKVLVGRDNLAANGLQIPGVNGMVFSGTAFGDWTLSCVRGTVKSVTFVFDDGTVRTVSSQPGSSGPSNSESTSTGSGGPSSGGSAGPGLGWISDRRGIPCISGSRISNATDYLEGRLLARGIETAGKAFAKAQTTVNNTPLGGVTSSVTGNAMKYALGETVSGGADELAKWIADRQSQQFEAVYVDTGEELAVHLDREIPIDYEPNGRRLDYARASTVVSRKPGGLD